MGERKVQAKYYPPDFDPSRLPRIRKKRQNEDAVRFMLPMSVRCEKCGEFMGTGLKFNAKKSDTGENYLGIRVFRFSMKCKACPSTFTIRTDPKNSDYSCESGVQRNYEPWREKRQAEEDGKKERERQDEDALQALENKTMDAKKQMEDLDELDGIKANNAKRATISVDDVLATEKAAERNRRRIEEKAMLSRARTAFNSRTPVSQRNMPNGNIHACQESTIKIQPQVNPVAVGKGFTLKVKKRILKPAAAMTNVRPSMPLVNYGSSSDSE